MALQASVCHFEKKHELLQKSLPSGLVWSGLIYTSNSTHAHTCLNLKLAKTMMMEPVKDSTAAACVAMTMVRCCP